MYMSVYFNTRRVVNESYCKTSMRRRRAGLKRSSPRGRSLSQCIFYAVPACTRGRRRLHYTAYVLIFLGQHLFRRTNSDCPKRMLT